MRQVQEIIDRAYARQKNAQQGVDADEDAELRPLLFDILSTFFTIGARVNPEFFAQQESVDWDAVLAGWTRPANAELIYWIEDESTDEVARVPRDDQGAERSMPSVFRLGQVYYPVDPTGAGKGPSSDEALLFIYAKKPDDLPDLSSDIDPLWPTGHESLLDLELAINIAQKDRRFDDVQWLVTLRDRQLVRFIWHIEHEDVGERRRRGNVRRFARSSIMPVSSLLAGGSSVELP